VQDGFTAIGPKMTAQRVAAFTATVASLRELKTERAASIGTLCATVRELWEEMETGPTAAATDADDANDEAAFEACIAGSDADGLGYGAAVITRLQAKVATLEAERVRCREGEVGGSYTACS